MKKVNRLCSEKIQDYFVFESQMQNLKEQLEYEEKNQDVNSFIKSKNRISNKVENEVIKKIMIENKINQTIIWHSIIGDILERYKKTYKPKYNYIIEKFMNHKKDDEIGEKLYMSTTTQYRYKAEIVCQVAIIGLSKHLISINELLDEEI
jgi:hypothetical protein